MIDPGTVASLPASAVVVAASLVDPGPVATTPGDLLRLLVVPVFGWAAWRDVRTRRVPNRTWYPLAVLGIGLLAWDAWTALDVGGAVWELFAVRAGISLGFVIPLSYLFWRLGGFGGADAKALMVLAVLFPTYPTYLLGPALVELGLPGVLPAVDTGVAVFSFTVLTNAVLVGMAFPVALVVRNAVAGRFTAIMAVGRPVAVDAVDRKYGRLLETPDGSTGRGLDLDALRMYLRWRGATLADLRADPGRYRDPATLPEDPGDPGDGTVESAREAEVLTDGGGGPVDGEPADTADDENAGEGTAARDDPWGAEAFIEAAPGDAYGTTPGEVRDGLEVLVDREDVWVSPGLPFMVPLFLGLVVGFAYGDLLYGILLAAGLV